MHRIWSLRMERLVGLVVRRRSRRSGGGRHCGGDGAMDTRANLPGREGVERDRLCSVASKVSERIALISLEGAILATKLSNSGRRV